jgi:two-component system, LytTR family, response regulator
MTDLKIEAHIVAAEEQLRRTLARLVEKGSASITVNLRRSDTARPERYARRLPVRPQEGVIRYLAVENIDWIEAANQYVRVHAEKKGHLLRESLARLESWLEPERFLRIHRSVIVNLERIEELRIQSPTHRRAVLRGGQSLRVSPLHWEKLQAALFGFR